MIKVVFCDLGGVLVLNRAPRIYKKYAEQYNVSQENIHSVFDFIHSGDRTDEELNNYLWGVNISRETWDSFLKEFYSSEVKNQTLFELLQKFKKNSIGVVLITTNNMNSSTFKISSLLEKFDLSDFKNYIISSGDLGVVKPEQEFWVKSYDYLTEKVGKFGKNEILVIDDSDLNCKSAEEYGLQAFLYIEEKNEELKELLNKTK